jgi:hypothetical protein
MPGGGGGVASRGVPLSRSTHGSQWRTTAAFALFHTAMVLLDQAVQVSRRAQLGVSGEPAIGFQLTHL